MQINVNDIAEILSGKKQYDPKDVSDDLYKAYPLFGDVVNNKAGDIIKSLFDFFGVESELPFDRVAARIFDGSITIGSVLAKIKQIRDAGNEITEPKKTDDEIIKGVMEDVKKQKAAPKPVPEIPAPALIPKQHAIDTANNDAAETIKTVDQGTKTAVAVNEQEKNKIKMTKTVEKEPAKPAAEKKVPAKVPTDGGKEALDALKTDLGDDVVKYMIKIREAVSKLVEKDVSENFIKNFNKFAAGKGKDVLTGFGGNKDSIVATMGYMVLRDIVGDKNMPLGTKKSFYDHLGIKIESCRRAEQKLGELFA